jgi:hypothetical protein
MVIAQKPTQSLAASHRLRTTRVRDARKQQDVGLSLMISLSMIVYNIFAYCPPQGAVTKKDDLRQALIFVSLDFETVEIEF